MSGVDAPAPWRIAFDNARDPYTARNALGAEKIGGGGGGGGGGAPDNAEYIVAATDATLTAERVLTNTASITWDFTTPGQAKASTTAGGGNVSNSGTPTSGQYAKWLTATTIQGVAPATVLSDIGAQPAGSYQPLDADLTAIAALTGTNTIYYRSAANTWSPVTIGSNMTFTGGTLDSVAGGGGGTSTIVAPQGRLSCNSSGNPVPTTSITGSTTMTYANYVGDKAPIYDGTAYAMKTINPGFTYVSISTLDTTRNPAAIGASKCNDWFLWDGGAGALYLSHGPDWTNDTTRSAGTALVMVNGIWLNAVAITNACGAQRGTWVGTTRSNASSTIDWIYGGLAAGGTAGFFGVANAYNQVEVRTLVSDSTDSWTYGTATWRASNAAGTGSGLNMRVSYVDPLGTGTVAARNYGSLSHPSGFSVIGIGVDTTSAFSGTPGAVGASVVAPVSAEYAGIPGLGFHFIQAIEYATAGAAGAFRGDNGTPAYSQTGLWFGFRA